MLLVFFLIGIFLLCVSSCNGLQWMSERRPATPFYLHKRDEPVLFHYEIDLLAKEANVALKHSPTSLVQEGLGQCFEPASAAYGVQEGRLTFRVGAACAMRVIGMSGRNHSRRGHPKYAASCSSLYFFDTL